MKVLITGASGFIGLPLSNKLAELGCDILAISRSTPSEFHKDISWIKSDLSSLEEYKAQLISFGPEVLIHLAWQDIPDFSIEKSLFNLNQSIEFIYFVSEIDSLKKILISGSCWEYGKTHGECVNTDIVNPQNYFTLSKHSLRLWAEIITKQMSINLGWFRLFYVYGPGQRAESLIPSILHSLKAGRMPNIKTPHNANDYIYIDDVVDAFSNATVYPINSDIYNLGSGKSTSALNICRYAEKIALNSSSFSRQIKIDSKSLDSDIDFWAEINTSKDKLKWSPKVSIVEGIQKTWDHLQQI